LSEPYLTRVKRDLKRLQMHFPGAVVAELTGARLLGYFEARRAAHKTFNNRRGVVSAFMTAAHALYRSCGFVDIEPYAESEIPDEFKSSLVLMEKNVRSAQ
jgi:hypothetical protein